MTNQLKITSAPVPVFIMEEHHEAFILWHYAMDKGLMAARGSLLLHVDAHSDLEPPVLLTPLKENLQSLSSIAGFTYSELGVDSFILPALHRGIFDSYCWIYQPMGGLASSIILSKYVRTYRDRGIVYVSGPAEQPTGSSSGERSSCFCLMTAPLKDLLSDDGSAMAADIRATLSDKVREYVLDIDLDYFSLSEHDSREQVIEITEQEHGRISKDPYHFIRLEGKCSLEQRDGKFFLSMNRKRGIPIPSAAQVSQDEIDRRIDELGRYLSCLGRRPVLIHLCRSRHSGYTPIHQWRDIETRLLRMLEEQYGSLDVQSFSSLPI